MGCHVFCSRSTEVTRVKPFSEQQSISARAGLWRLQGLEGVVKTAGIIVLHQECNAYPALGVPSRFSRGRSSDNTLKNRRIAGPAPLWRELHSL